MTEPLTERKPGRPVDEQLRRRAVAAVVERGMSARAAGRLFEVAGASVSRWVRQYRGRGQLRPARQGGCRPSLIEPERERVFRLLEARPELGIHALRAALAAEGLAFGFGTVQRFLRRHGLERRKRLDRRRKAAAKASAVSRD